MQYKCLSVSIQAQTAVYTIYIRVLRNMGSKIRVKVQRGRDYSGGSTG